MSKKLSLFVIMFMTVFSMLFVSCSEKFETYTYADVQKAKFEQSFATTFGEIEPSHNWGFDMIKVYNDESNTTRGHDVNGNMWYLKYVRPVNVTSSEAAKVLAEFSHKEENAQNTISLPWENYWVQQVYQGIAPSYNGVDKDVYPKDVMNQLIAYNFNKGEYEHVNNFNNANNTTSYSDDVTHEKFIGTTLMIDMGSGDNNKQFGYHNTSDSKYHYEYIIKKIDGAYYVGFDIVGYHPYGQDANANMDVDRDWIFNDWIVKISPAIYNMEGGARIIAEDLGASASDFDYNDVVFDVKFYNEYPAEYNYQGKLFAYIVLRAAGGTLPLTIAGHEVHNLFGVDTNVMVNTRNGTVTKDPVSFKVMLGNADYNSTGMQLARMIPVIVQYNNEAIILDTETGKAPEKIAVTTSFEWCSERTPIYDVYPLFKEWVKDKTVVWY